MMRQIQLTVGLLIVACGAAAASGQSARAGFDAARNRMVDDEIVAAGVKDPRVIQSMRDTQRHEFVSLKQRDKAYYDMALPIGAGQTISPPFVVAYMTESLDPQPDDKVLEIGTGSGYQAAVLSPLVRDVYTIEIVEHLGRKAEQTLKRLHYDNVHTKVGDGYLGWPEHAPFDKIIVTCSPEKVPDKLVEQLKEGGRMVIPVGERYQQTLYLMKKTKGKMVSEALQPTLFVPMTGQAESQRQVKPDPTRPAIENGAFEKLAGEPPRLVGWHYQRQLKVQSDNAPEGKNYVTFSNAEPGRGSQALQGFAIDGRQVATLDLSVHVRAKDVRPGQNEQQLPGVVIAFYDDTRGTVAEIGMGAQLWRGTFGWQTETKRIIVPKKAREAIIRIGLFGAVGEISLDDLRLTPVKRESTKGERRGEVR